MQSAAAALVNSYIARGWRQGPSLLTPHPQKYEQPNPKQGKLIQWQWPMVWCRTSLIDYN